MNSAAPVWYQQAVDDEAAGSPCWNEPTASLAYVNGSAVDVAADWPDADLSVLSGFSREVPAFPVDLLGARVAAWVNARAAENSCPVDYVATALLTGASGLLANVRWPQAGAAWREPPVLWGGLVGAPSSGKTPAIRPVSALIACAEAVLGEGYEERRAETAAAALAADIRHKAWKADVAAAVEAGENPPPRPADAYPVSEVVKPRVWVGDCTSERLAGLIEGNPRGLLIHRDELTGWIGGFGRYSSGGADRSMALESYNGGQFRVDRQNHPEGLNIAHLSLAVLGGAQPDKVAEMIAGADDGLIARILWTWPAPVGGFTLSRTASAGRGLEDAFERLARLKMHEQPDGTRAPVIVRYSKAAEDAIEAFYREAKAAAQGAYGPKAGALGKAPGHVLRLSAVLTYADWAVEGGAEPTEIAEGAVHRAAGLVSGYFEPMASRVFGDAAMPAAERAAVHVAKHIQQHHLDTFNARDLRRAIGGVVREAAGMDQACAALCEADLIRPVPTRKGVTAGRAAKAYIVHPQLWRGDA